MHDRQHAHLRRCTAAEPIRPGGPGLVDVGRRVCWIQAVYLVADFFRVNTNPAATGLAAGFSFGRVHILVDFSPQRIQHSGYEFWLSNHGNAVLSAVLPFLIVGLGSMVGGVSRYGMTLVTQSLSVFSIPYGTLLSNLAGCLVIGVVAGISGKTELLSSEMRLLLATGFCGGFTTMSSFIYELGQFIQDKEYFYASSYLIGTLAGAGLAFVLGLLLSQAILR